MSQAFIITLLVIACSVGFKGTEAVSANHKVNHKAAATDEPGLGKDSPSPAKQNENYATNHVIFTEEGLGLYTTGQ
jgi:hypothetical protein